MQAPSNIIVHHIKSPHLIIWEISTNKFVNRWRNFHHAVVANFFRWSLKNIISQIMIITDMSQHVRFPKRVMFLGQKRSDVHKTLKGVQCYAKWFRLTKKVAMRMMLTNKTISWCRTMFKILIKWPISRIK